MLQLKYSRFLYLILLGVAFGLCAPFSGYPQSRVEDLDHDSILKDSDGGKSFPCFMKQLKYYDGYPASVAVSTRDPNYQKYKTGFITSGEYKNAKFAPPSLYPGEGALSIGTKKIYYKTYKASDFATCEKADYPCKEGKYLGHARYNSEVVKEPYIEEIHGKWPFENNPISGDSIVKPRLYIKRSLGFAVNKEVVYERCTTGWFVPAYRPDVIPQYKAQYPTFPFEDKNGWIYNETATPTFWGYLYGTRGEEEIDNWARASEMFLVVGQGIPILGSVISVSECWEKGGYLCWAGAGLDVASDIVMFARIGKVAAYLKGTNSKICRVVGEAVDKNIDVYTVSAGNLSLGALYSARGEYMKGLGRMVAGGADFATAVIATKNATIGVRIVDENKLADECVEAASTEVNAVCHTNSAFKKLPLIPGSSDTIRPISSNQQFLTGQSRSAAYSLVKEGISCNKGKGNLGSGLYTWPSFTDDYLEDHALLAARGYANLRNDGVVLVGKVNTNELNVANIAMIDGVEENLEKAWFNLDFNVQLKPHQEEALSCFHVINCDISTARMHPYMTNMMLLRHDANKYIDYEAVLKIDKDGNITRYSIAEFIEEYEKNNLN